MTTRLLIMTANITTKKARGKSKKWSEILKNERNERKEEKRSKERNE